MKLRKGGTISLPAFFQTASGDPVTGKTLSEVLFDIDYTDGTTPSEGNSATRELGDGWYAYDYTDTNGKDFIYIARDSTGTYKNFPGGYVEIINIEAGSGTHTHADSTAEQTVKEFTITQLEVIRGFKLDLVNLTQSVTIKIYCKIDGTNYREIDSLDWTTSDRDGVIIGDIYSDKDVKITLTSSALEGASRDVPYNYVEEVL